MSETGRAELAPVAEPASLFLRACRRLPVERSPVWLMRQAGRYMPEYRALRAKHGILDIIRAPELAAEVTLQPIRAFGFDAAIIFADILPPLVGMGLELAFTDGDGPRISNRITGPRDVDRLGTPPAEETMPHTLDGDPHRRARAGGERHAADRIRRRAVHARLLRHRRGHLEVVRESEGADVR